MNKKYILLGIMIVVIVATASMVQANPKFFANRVQTATATTTIEYMTPGTATTTLTFDTSLINQADTGVRNTNTLTSLTLATQFTASSTVASVLKWRYEYSNDNEDWYPESMLEGFISTTTPEIIGLKGYNEYKWITASSTCQVVTNGCRSHRLVNVPVATRYVRVLFYMSGSPASHNNGGIWAELVPIKEMSE